MEQAEINLILDKALTKLFQNEPDIFQFTSHTHQSEWNLAHHYAKEVQEYFIKHGYSCDLDIIKVNFNNMRPDIIIHKRGTHVDNLLVIEVKRDGNRTLLDADKEKIKTQWFHPPLSYQFGAVVNIGQFAGSVEVFRNSYDF